ncbi:MAG: hypothetical protein LBK00_04195 [Treponema sp.]|jgi:hypothetical protein|nr:hypothetical protein [Treponema sp.]
MPHKKDWYPNSRDEQVHLVETWLKVFLTKALAWGIPPVNVTSLTDTLAAAKDILAVVKSGERTAASVVGCNEAFKEMEAEARFIKKRYLLIPPLTPADLADILLSQPDNTHTPVPPPTGQPSVSITYPGGPHLLKVHLTFLAGTAPLDSRSDSGYAIYKGVMPQGGATLEQAASVKHYLMKPPLDGEELLYYKFTRRRTEVVSFTAEESGMTAYFCSRYENGKGDAGGWGPIVSAVIP